MVDKKVNMVYIVHGDSNMVFGVFRKVENAQILLDRLMTKYPTELFWFVPYDFDDELVYIMELGSK